MTAGVLTLRARTVLIRFLAVTGATAVLVGLASNVATADTIVLSTAASPFTAGVANQGWWADRNETPDENMNYLTGNLPDPRGEPGFALPSEHRSFFTFNLEPLDFTTQRITGASLVVNGGRYGGTDSVETLGLFDVNTPAAALNNNGSLNPVIFADLGTGASYGTFQVSRYDEDAMLTFPLNAVALSDIVRNDEAFFSIGGRLLSITSTFDFIFGITGPPASLVIETEPLVLAPVPEPTSMLLLAAGLLGLVARRRTSRKSSS
jgi:hypothetical protein